jgi:DNA-binding transcriptional LysR family regulator
MTRLEKSQNGHKIVARYSTINMNHLRLMETFVGVVRTGNFSATARQLGVSRAIVSRHIQQLEEHIGARLLNRTTRVVSVTDVGQEYYEACTRLIEEIDGLETNLRRGRSEAKGVLKLSLPASLGVSAIATAAMDFSEAYPGIRVSLVLSDPAPHARDLFENGHDVVIRLSDIQAGSVVRRKIGTSRWIIGASPAYLATQPPVLEPADLQRHNCLSHLQYARNDVWRLRCDGRDYAIKTSGTITTNNGLILKNAALAGRGISMLPSYVCHDELQSGALVRVLPAYHVHPEKPIYVFYADRRFVPRKIKLFVDFIAQWLGAKSMQLATARENAAARSV